MDKATAAYMYLRRYMIRKEAVHVTGNALSDGAKRTHRYAGYHDDWQSKRHYRQLQQRHCTPFELLAPRVKSSPRWEAPSICTYSIQKES